MGDRTRTGSVLVNQLRHHQGDLTFYEGLTQTQGPTVNAHICFMV